MAKTELMLAPGEQVPGALSLFGADPGPAFFGAFVEFEGNRLAVVSTFANTVYVFERQSTDWVYRYRITPGPDIGDDFQRRTVAMSGRSNALSKCIAPWIPWITQTGDFPDDSPPLPRIVIKSSIKEGIMIDLIAVQSSMIAAAGYDPGTRKMVVLFNNGKAYEYYDVPQEAYQGLMGAESKGRYMHTHIIGTYQDAPFRGWEGKAEKS